MNIIIIANFPDYLDGRREKGRFLYLAEMLCSRGHQVKLVVSDFVHERLSPRDKVSDSYKTQIVMLHEPGYSSRISFQRLRSHYNWGKNVGKYLESIEKPDVVYCAIPSQTVGVVAGSYCKRNKIRYIIDVQDLWPEGFLFSIKNKLLQKIVLSTKFYVNKAYAAADVVVGVSDTYVQRALCVNKKTRTGLPVYLGNDGELFDEAREKGKIDYNDGIVRIGYIGALSYSYDIPCILRALKLYKDSSMNPPMKFICMGNGPLRESFEQLARELDVDCEFTGALPYEEMVGRLCSCNILVNPIVHGALQSITNKIGDYALAGLPVINTQENEEYRALVKKYEIGINCNCGDEKEVYNALKHMVTDKAYRNKLGANMRQFGIDFFDRRNSYLKIVQAIEE